MIWINPVAVSEGTDRPDQQPRTETLPPDFESLVNLVPNLAFRREPHLAANDGLRFFR
jgi:hypothetical protein